MKCLEDKKPKTYSWSKLNSFHSALEGDGCLHGWYKTYIEGDRGSQNFFSEYGTLFHKLIEKLNKSEILAWDVEDEIARGLANIEFSAPLPKMGKSYDEAIYRFFNEFDDVFDGYHIQQAEEEKLFSVGDASIKGFPDIIGQHKEHGMIIADIKTSKPYKGDDLRHKAKQMYIYSIPFYNEYGYYPDNLVYLFVRERTDRELVIKFDINELERTKQWVIDTVKTIEEFAKEYVPSCSDQKEDSFYAKNLCNHRLVCPHFNTYTNSVNAVL